MSELWGDEDAAPDEDAPAFDPLGFAGLTEPELLARLRLARHERGQWVPLPGGPRACCLGPVAYGDTRSEYLAAGIAYVQHGGRQWMWSIHPPEGWTPPAGPAAEQLSLW